jgi:hypothetical protein
LPVDDLRTYGFTEDVISAVEALTKHEGEEYGDAVAMRLRSKYVSARVILNWPPSV